MRVLNRAMPAAFLLFALAFFLVPYSALDHLRLMPGDVGDARLVHYLLESIHQFFLGNLASTWHPGYFAPFPYVLGFSDNMYGSYPVYGLIRVFTNEPEIAFQLWFFFGYFANFSASYYTLRKLEFLDFAAAVGAIIFSFSLITSTHMGHPQLLYRFGLPLAVFFYIKFLEKKNWSHFLMAAFWLVWQLFCSIYIGFFTGMMLLLISIVFFIRNSALRPGPKTLTIGKSFNSWSTITSTKRWRVATGFLLLIASTMWLFYPYAVVSSLYHAKRSSAEIALMLPRVQSYFTGEISLLWGSLSKDFPALRMSNEHQMFAGVISLLLATFGIFTRKSTTQAFAFPLLIWSALTAIVLTLNVYGVSFWVLLLDLPLFSAIRAVTRLDLTLLMPLSFFAALTVQHLQQRDDWKHRSLMYFLVLILLFEFSAIRPYASEKSKWTNRTNIAMELLPTTLPNNAMLFFAQTTRPEYASELEAMWVALLRGVRTLNGYSGFNPPGYSNSFGSDCTELPKRILAYLEFSGAKSNISAYKSLMSQTLPIGFDNCSNTWLDAAPTQSITTQPYTPELIHQIRLRYLNRRKLDGRWEVSLEIKNLSPQTLAAGSSAQRPFHLAWVFADDQGTPSTRWKGKRTLPFDLAGNSSMVLKILIDPKMEVPHGTLQIFMGQQAIPGLPPLLIPWN